MIWDVSFVARSVALEHMALRTPDHAGWVRFGGVVEALLRVGAGGEAWRADGVWATALDLGKSELAALDASLPCR